MRAIAITNRTVWMEGQEIDNWCLEDDGESGVEHIILFQGKRYSVKTDCNNNLNEPNKMAQEYEG